jgi:PemK-like, MazF-like toxin of type II toxin-antitoxin system
MMATRHPYRRGDVILIQFPFSSASGQKDRPAIVLSTDLYHDQWDELLVLAVTSRSPKTMRPTDCAITDWRAAGLQYPSWIRSHLATVHRQLVINKLGVLVSADMQAVESCLRVAPGL